MNITIPRRCALQEARVPAGAFLRLGPAGWAACAHSPSLRSSSYAQPRGAFTDLHTALQFPHRITPKNYNAAPIGQGNTRASQPQANTAATLAPQRLYPARPNRAVALVKHPQNGALMSYRWRVRHRWVDKPPLCMTMLGPFYGAHSNSCADST